MTTEKSKKQPSQNEDAEQLSFENSSEDAEKDQDESRPQENVVQAEEENTAATESDAQLADVEEDVVELTYEELQEKVESLNVAACGAICMYLSFHR